MLATDNVNKFSDLAGALRWVFKVFDYKAKGELQVDQVPQLLLALFRYDINVVNPRKAMHFTINNEL